MPAPSVAAMSEKTEPAVPPALNLRFVYRAGDNIYKSKLILK